MIRNLQFLIPGIVVLFVLACKKDKPIPSTGIMLPASSITYVGGKDTIKSALIPQNTSDKVTWNTSDPAVATVDKSGVVTGISVGNVVITAAAGSNSAKSNVSVYKWATYTATNSGLASNAVYSMAIDKHGNKWFGTSKGVSKYDGFSWTTYNTANSGIADDRANAIAIDADGNEWFVGNNGAVSKFDGTNWTVYDTSNGMPDAASNMTIDIHNNKWFGTQDGVLKFDGSKWTKYTNIDNQGPNYWVYAMGADAKGNVWAAVFLARIWKFDGSAWTTYNSQKDGWYGNTPLAVTADNDDNMWFGFALEGADLLKYDGTTWTNSKFSSNPLEATSITPYPGLGILAIAVDAQNNKWCGFDGNGVGELDGTGNWLAFNQKNSPLISDYICADAVDQQGNKWFCAYNQGGGVSELFGQ